MFKTRDKNIDKFDISLELMDCFPNGFVNHIGEFIAHKFSNSYFVLRTCKTEIDVNCKILESLSRSACKGQPYASDKKNKEFHKFMLDGINKFLNTDFTEEDMELIYTYLGNGCNHKLTVKFVKSGYDMNVLKEE